MRVFGIVCLGLLVALLACLCVFLGIKAIADFGMVPGMFILSVFLLIAISILCLYIDYIRDGV